MLISNSKALFLETPLKNDLSKNIKSNQLKADSVAFTSNKKAGGKEGNTIKGLALAAICIAEFIALKSNVIGNKAENPINSENSVELIDLSDIQPELNNVKQEPKSEPIPPSTEEESDEPDVEISPQVDPPKVVPPKTNDIAKATITPRETSKFGNIIHIKYDEAPQSELTSVGSGIKVRRTTAQAFNKMVLAAENDGVNIVTLSGFRSVSTQNQLFYGVARQRGQTPAQRATVSAPPGFSEHHTGYAIDVGDGNNSSSNLSTSFEDTRASQWLRKNMSNFGFELSFPQNNIQNINYEPWHIRFIGDEASQKEFEFAKSLSKN
jgi:D-alanyl-D-alanine carboxypeptidase